MSYIYLFSFEDSRTFDRNTGYLYSHISNSPFEGRNIDSMYSYIPLDKTVRNISLDRFRCNSIQRFLEDIPDNQSDGRNNDSVCSHILLYITYHNIPPDTLSYNLLLKFQEDIL